MFNFDISAVEGSSGSLTAYQEQTSNTRFNATAASMVNGQWHSFASRLSGSSVTAWRDGAIVATNNSGPTTTLVDAAQILCIGGLNASGYGVIGGIGLVSAFSRDLQDWEMRALYSDPMGLVRPAPRRTFFIPDAGGPPAISGTSAVTLPSLVANGSATRTIPDRTATSPATLPKLTASATGSRTIPTRTATSAVTVPVVTESASGTRTLPTRTGTTSVTFKPLASTAAGSRTIPDRTVTSAVALKPLTAAATGDRTIPDRTGTSAVVLKALTSIGAGSRTVPGSAGTSAVTLPPPSEPFREIRRRALLPFRN
jgi:hypothetical protein